MLINWGEVDYESELSEGRKIDNVFHAYCLKKAIGKQVMESKEVSSLDDEGNLDMKPKEIF